jgi:hypothetical protein
VREHTKWALQEAVGWQEFEDICTDYLYCQQGYTNIRQAGKTRDGGRDAVVLHGKNEAIVFAFSMEQNPLAGQSSKFYREYSQWEDKSLEMFVFVSNQNLGAKKIDLQKQLSKPPVNIFDITDLVRFLDFTDNGKEVKQKYGLEERREPIMVQTEDGQEEEFVVTREYTVLSFEDVSHGVAKRYSANLLVNEPIFKSNVKKIVKEVTANLRGREYYRDELVKARWAGTPAHVVWLFVYASIDDVDNANWICRTQWISEALAPKFAPLKLSGNDAVDQIVIDWNDAYLQKAKMYQALTTKKEKYLDEVDSIRKRTKDVVAKAIELTEEQETGQLAYDDYVSQMKIIEPALTELYFASGDIGLPPVECKDIDQAFQGMMAFAHNIVLPFSERGLATWPEKNRKYLVRDAVKGYLRDFERLKFELEKVRR